MGYTQRMFRLQRLEITGFKSFADYTELVFTGDGITAVVGPNGCGKSNVADAIAWVLGEQRVKHLRGAEMKDVIFQGSRNRSASGMAEVVLHLVCDETAGEDPDVDDIDSALEEIDEQTEAVEERLAPAVAEDEATTTSTEVTADVPAPVVTVEASITTTEAGDGDAAADRSATAPAIEAPAATASDAALLPSGTDAVGGENSETSLTKVRGRRHWRPRRLALEFAPGESVSVTRRLYRSGESEYLLNGRTCRLRDIQDLFSGTGLAGAHYAIIEQGRIGQILSAKPMDRRTLVEEAAGITKFRVRQRAAEARLEGARSNLHRISDIISEIERQTGSLRRQAAKARRYRQLREELRELLRRVYASDERALTALLEELKGRLAATSEEERVLAEELHAHEEEARRATAAARTCEEILAAARAAVADATLQRDRRERERTYQEEQRSSFEKRIADVAQEMDAVRARLAGVEAECESLRAVDTQLREASEETTVLLQAAESAYLQRVAEVAGAETIIDGARTELLHHTAVAERLMEIGRQLEAALERLGVQAEGLAREGERAASAHITAQAEAEDLYAEIGEARARFDSLHAEREVASHGVADARAMVSVTAAEYTRIYDESARVRHRLDTLTELDAQRALYSQAVQRIFTADEAPKDFHSIGTLADVLRVEPQWERAVESVFGSFLQSVIVPTPDDAVRAAAWLQANSAGRATFLVAGLHGASTDDNGSLHGHSSTALAEDSEAETDIRLGDLLGAPREIANVLGRTLAREMNARIVDNLERATTSSLASGEMYVTPAGEWIAGGQLLGVGGPYATEEGAGLLAFKREMRELEARTADLQAETLFAEQTGTAARARLGELEDALMLLNEVIGREEREHVARELRATQLTQEIERAARHLRVVADDASRLAEEQRTLEERRATQSVEAAAAEAARHGAAAEVVEATEFLAVARRAAEAESEHLSEQRAIAAAAAERRRATAADLRRMEAESADLRARLASHTLEVAEMEARIEELRRSMDDMAQNAAEVEDERAARERDVETATLRLTEARERADTLSLELTELNRRAAVARDVRAGLEVQKAEALARQTYLREACLTELSQPLEDLLSAYEPEEDFDLEAARARVEELRARVESFGAVNMMALEELAEAEERFVFLTSQRQDITDGILSTEEALREIKRRSRDRFRHAFEEINRNFSELFLDLFGGGRGEMSLIDADDVLESGIDIVAQPPGKRLQNVLLLSGGEKAMAALSLVLAIFRYRPSPFCLLDEVDAPLDEANIGRFTNKITDMSASTQFIVITHNKKTMEVARALYGVTMEEVGVSKLVSVRFE